MYEDFYEPVKQLILEGHVKWCILLPELLMLSPELKWMPLDTSLHTGVGKPWYLCSYDQALYVSHAKPEDADEVWAMSDWWEAVREQELA